MSYQDMHNTASLRAQAAAAFTQITALDLSKMDPALRQAYLSAYASAASRHNALSTAATAVRTSATAINNEHTPEKAELIVRKLFGPAIPFLKYLFFGLILWTICQVIPWNRTFLILENTAGPAIQDAVLTFLAGLWWLACLPVLIAWKLVEAIVWHPWVGQARQSARERLQRAEDLIVREIENIRDNWRFDAARMLRQIIIHWIDRHKLQLIVFFVGIHLASTMMQSQTNRTEVFVKWTELQQYIDDPLPQYLFRQRKEYGSNSHYHREINCCPDVSVNHDEQVPRLADDISVESITAKLLEEAATAPSEIGEEEKLSILRAAEVAFCQHCRQKHCCGIES